VRTLVRTWVQQSPIVVGIPHLANADTRTTKISLTREGLPLCPQCDRTSVLRTRAMLYVLDFIGDPGRIRTCDPLLRSQTQRLGCMFTHYRSAATTLMTAAITARVD
jgi:hypothetical protein